MGSVARRLLITGGASALAVLLLVLGLYFASRRVPEFYQRALATQSPTQVEDGQRFERAALALHNQLQHTGRWETHLTEDEINGWLAVDLLTKFPRVLPPGVSEPRVAIDDGVVRVAVRYQRHNVSTVLSIAGEAYLTAQPNEVAIRLIGARAGIVPVPLA